MIRKILITFACLMSYLYAASQCNGQLEPGFTFLTSSKGCSPFTVQIQTLFLGAVAGTNYRVDWGDGSAAQTVTQTNATGVILSHTYVASPVSCGYDVQIDAYNACNPLGSVIPVKTEVVVWNQDVVNISPTLYRVCQGFSTNVTFTDNSTWNCFPRATRENNAPRWLQWKYGTGPSASQIPNIKVNGIVPGSFPYLNPAPNTNPGYPFNATGSNSLTVNVPTTSVADIGKTFNVQLWNWNQCNPYDNNTSDGNPFNPVSGNLTNGDNAPQIGNAQIVIVSAPQPVYQTRLNNSNGVIKTIYCVNDVIYFQNLTPNIVGSNFSYRYEFYDDAAGTVLLQTKNTANPTFSYSTSGIKMIKLYVKDNNAFGNCENVYTSTVTINPVLQATISVSDFNNTPSTSNFCQSNSQPFTNFNVRFHDATPGVITASSQFRWEFYDNNNLLVFSDPAGPGVYSSTQIPFIDIVLSNLGSYKAVLYVRDNLTNCQTSATSVINITQNPVADFKFTTVCQNDLTSFTDASTLTPSLGDVINKREWDLNYNGVFNSNVSYLNKTNFTVVLGASGTYNVAERVTSSSGCFDIVVKQVKVLPLPIAQFNPTFLHGCSNTYFNIVNQSITGQPDIVDTYTWQIDKHDGLGFVTDSIQHSTDPGFSSNFNIKFNNPTQTDIFYDIRLIVTTVSGCSTTSSPVTLQISPAPNAGYSALNYFPFDPNCSPVSVNFQADQNTIKLAPIDYTWTVTNNTNTVLQQTSTGVVPDFTYTFVNSSQNVEDFKIDLKTTFSSGCSRDSVKTIRINPVPISTFTIDTVSLDCNKLRLKFTADKQGLNGYTWTVSINGLQVINSTTLGGFFEYDFIRQASTSNVTVTLATLNFASCNSPITSQNTTIPAITVFNADFTTTPISQYFPNTTFNINNLTNSGFTYSWDFGDGTTSNLQQPISHTYSTSNTYVIVLKATDGYCSTQVSHNVTVSPAISKLDFTYDPVLGCNPLVVNFTSDTLNIVPNSLTWQIGNLIYVTNNFSQTFTQSGNYDITLTARDINGKLLVVTKTVMITVNPVPDILVVPSKQDICDNSSTSLVLYNPNNSPNVTYQWTAVSDNVTGATVGSGSTGPIVDKLNLIDNTKPGTVTYDITAVSNSCYSTAQRVIVTVNPTPTINAKDTTICSGNRTNIKLSSNIPGATFNWTIGGINGNVYGAIGDTGNSIVQKLISDDKGGSVKYNISPVNAGCSGASLTINVTVQPSPVSRFTVRSFVLLTNDPLYVANGSIGADTYFWDFGDGSTSTEFEPTHMYSKAGAYSMFLVATNKIGCSDTSYLNAYIKITEGGKILVPNVFTPSGGVVGSQGVNDTFMPLVAGETDFDMQIFDRWGILMFETHNAQIGWDGTYNDKPCISDIYVYKINVKFKDGSALTKAGDFLLLR